MKKLFNVAVMFAALATALSFTSCETDEKNEQNVNEQQLTSLEVEVGKKYSFSNGDNDLAGSFEVTDKSDLAGSKTVTMLITCDKTSQKGDEITLGEAADMPSYVIYDGTKLVTAKQSVAQENASKVIMALKTDASVATITDGTVNKVIGQKADATTTYFAEKSK